MGGETYDFPEHSVAIYAPGVMHNQWMNKDDIGIDQCFLLKLKGEEWPFKTGVVIIREIRHGYLFRELQECDTWISDDRGIWAGMLDMRISAIFSGLAMEFFLHEKSSMSSPAERHAEDAKKLLESKIGETRKIKDISKRLGLNPDYLRHVFKEHYGMTITSFMLMVRVNRARELLRYSSLCLKEIAPSCGFANERQMCVTFKKVMGISPGRYRIDSTRSFSEKYVLV